MILSIRLPFFEKPSVLHFSSHPNMHLFSNSQAAELQGKARSLSPASSSPSSYPKRLDTSHVLSMRMVCRLCTCSSGHPSLHLRALFFLIVGLSPPILLPVLGVVIYPLTNFIVAFIICLPAFLMQTLKRVLHSLSCGKFKVLKRIAAGATSEVSGEKEKGAGGLIKPTDSFIFNAAFRYQRILY